MVLLFQSIDAHTEEVKGIKNGDVDKLQEAQKRYRDIRNQLLEGAHYTTRGSTQ